MYHARAFRNIISFIFPILGKRRSRFCQLLRKGGCGHPLVFNEPPCLGDGIVGDTYCRFCAMMIAIICSSILEKLNTNEKDSWNQPETSTVLKKNNGSIACYHITQFSSTISADGISFEQSGRNCCLRLITSFSTSIKRTGMDNRCNRLSSYTGK